MLLRFLFGDDIFISYSRKDGANYAAALANDGVGSQTIAARIDAGRAPEVSARIAK